MLPRLLKYFTERATAAERSQLLNQNDPNVFGQSYIANTSSIDGQSAFLDEPAKTRHIQYLQGVSRFHENGLPASLPAEKEALISQNPELLQLQEEVEQLIKDCADEYTISMAKQNLRRCRRQIKDEALRQYRVDWVQERRDWKILSRGKELPKDPVRTDVAQDIFRIMPERARVAKMMLFMRRLSVMEKLQAVLDLCTLCIQNVEVLHLPNEKPIGGACPVEKCQLPMER